NPKEFRVEVKSPKLSAIFIHDADSILPDSNMFCFRKTQEHLNVLFGVFNQEYFENFTNNLKDCFVSFPNC
ncbi:hypothetical protein ACXZ7R_26255, partial [Vibrio campbellii]